MSATLDIASGTPDHKHHLDYNPGLWGRLSASLAHEQGWEFTYAERALNEAIRYFIFCGRHPGEEFVCSTIVDKATDHFILRTRDNHQFCNVVIGRFIHHIPLDEEDVDNLQHSSCYQSTMAAMKSEGHYLDPAIWVEAAAPCYETGDDDRCKHRTA